MTKKRINALIFALLVLATLYCGYAGWTRALADVKDLPPFEIFYRTLLAFTGDSVYVATPENKDTLNGLLAIARVTGLGATISALFGLALVFLGGKAKRLRACFTSGRQVIVGASDFAVDYAARQGKVTVFDTAEKLELLDQQSRDAKGLWLPDRMDERTATGAGLGRSPKQVIFGDKDAITNVQRARLWLQNIPRYRRQNIDLTLRVEDNSVARDLGFLSEEFQHVKLISRGEMVARALVTGMAPTHLAQIRGQTQVHVVLIGLGKVNLAVAEELVLRCHHASQKPLRLTIIDNRMGDAQSRLHAERPDLLNPEFKMHGPFIDFLDMDALECCSEHQVEQLTALEKQASITAIVAAAGDDKCNLAIALRMRQSQLENLCLKAPIFMRSDNLTSIAPKPVRDLTSGIVPFGGRMLDAEDLELEEFYDAQAKAIHNRWRDTLGPRKAPENAWENLSTQAQRSSRRAALASVEMFYASGMVPPFGKSVAGLRAHESAVQDLLDNSEVMDRLWRTEHNRWNAERRAEGYRGQMDGPRDDEKKLHPLIIACDDLPRDQVIKDRNNVELALKGGAQRYRDSRGRAGWRQVLRVGVLGPLWTDTASLDTLKTRFEAAFAENVLPNMGERDLEILSPNAPGFDRSGAVALLAAWRALTKRRGRVVLFDVARVPLVDKIAAEHLIENIEDPEEQKQVYQAALTDFDAELSDLERAAEGQLRRVDMRPVGVSDADFDADRDAYFRNVRAVQDHILSLADMMIFETNAGQSQWTLDAYNRWDASEAVKLRLS